MPRTYILNAILIYMRMYQNNYCLQNFELNKIFQSLKDILNIDRLE